MVAPRCAAQKRRDSLKLERYSSKLLMHDRVALNQLLVMANDPPKSPRGAASSNEQQESSTHSLGFNAQEFLDLIEKRPDDELSEPESELDCNADYQTLHEDVPGAEETPVDEQDAIEQQQAHSAQVPSEAPGLGRFALSVCEEGDFGGIDLQACAPAVHCERVAH